MNRYSLHSLRQQTVFRIVSVVAALFAVDMSFAQSTITVDFSADTRVISEPSGVRDDNNGGEDGNTLIGRNTSNIFNYMLYNFDLSPLVGETLDGDATLRIVGRQLGNVQRGDSNDSIEAYEIFTTNANWLEGTGKIGGSDIPADDGSATFLNQAQFNGSGTTVPWKDAAGTNVSDLLAATSLLGSLPAYENPAIGEFAILDYTVDQAKLQQWVDSGFAGIMMNSTDGGFTGITDDRGRFWLYDAQIIATVSDGSTAGDFNGDGQVDAADYTVWRDNLGASDAALNGAGTGDPSGLVVAADYELWRTNFGSGSVVLASIPEPSSLCLLAFAGLLVARRSRQQPHG